MQHPRSLTERSELREDGVCEDGGSGEVVITAPSPRTVRGKTKPTASSTERREGSERVALAASSSYLHKPRAPCCLRTLLMARSAAATPLA